MWDFLQTLSGKVSIISASVIGIITILQKFTSLKIWKWIHNKIEKEREKKLKPITDKIDKLANLIEDNRVKELRYQILDFENALINGKKINNLEYFNNIEELIHEYEDTYGDRHNGEIKQSISFIREREQELKKETYLKNKEG